MGTYLWRQIDGRSLVQREAGAKLASALSRARDRALMRARLPPVSFRASIPAEKTVNQVRKNIIEMSLIATYYVMDWGIP